MSGFIEGENRLQATMFPERLDDYINEDNSVRVIDVFIDSLDLSGLGIQDQSRKYRTPWLPPVRYAQAVCLWVPESSAIVSST